MSLYEICLLKMQEYGFCGFKHLMKDKSMKQRRNEARQKLIQKYGKLGEDIAKLYEEKDKIKENLDS